MQRSRASGMRIKRELHHEHRRGADLLATEIEVLIDDGDDIVSYSKSPCDLP